MRALIPNDRCLSREEIGLQAEDAYYTRALSLYNPFGNNFFACSRQGCELYPRPIRYAKLFCKNPVLTGLSAPSGPSAIGNLAQPKIRIATGKLIGCDLGLFIIDIPAIFPVRRKKVRSIRLAKNQLQGLGPAGHYRADDYLRARRQSLSTNNSENPHRKSTNSK